MKSPNSKQVLHPITRLIVGGAQENTIYTAALLDKERFQAEILSGPQTGSEGSLIEEVEKLGVPLTIIPELVRQLSPLNDLKALWKMYRFMRNGRYSIVHTHSSKAGILGRMAARFAGVPIIFHTVHGWPFHDYMAPATRRFYITLERLAASFTQTLIVVTVKDYQKGLAVGIGKAEQYTLIRSAIPLDIFNPEAYDGEDIRSELGIPSEAVVIGNVGRFSEQKNPLDWVRVAGAVGRADSKCYFLLVGDGPLQADVEAALAFEGISDRTILTGLRRDPARMLAAMDIFLLTSLWEGLPRVLPQSMAMKIPVIANRVGGTAEIIRHGVNGFLCKPGDTQTAADFCLVLMQEPLLRRNMGLAGYQTVIQEFDLRKMIVDIEKVYEIQLQRIT